MNTEDNCCLVGYHAMVKNIKDISLALFFTGGVGLQAWDHVGNLDRELAIYHQLSNQLKSVHIVSYGGNQDLCYAASLGNLFLHPVAWLRTPFFTRYFVMARYKKILEKVDIFKTNQILGSDIPLWLKEKMGKKVIVRCGYLYSDFMKQNGVDKRTLAQAIALEGSSFQTADAGVVTSNWQRDIVIRDYKVPNEKIHVIPNYVVTDLFKPVIAEKTFDLIYVGRCGKEKNVYNLLQAMSLLKKQGKNYRLHIVGGCSNDPKIRKIASASELNIVFSDNVPNSQLPVLLNSATSFILPSFHEGHPKSLLEAMSCGLPCIGSNVQGIREDIIHNETGYLCNTEPSSIANAIHTVMTDESLQMEMGRKARKYILSHYSLDMTVHKELDLLQKVMAE
ncbi:MAG: glycosyltransferase family 4 protein [Methanoregula sp.]